MKAIKITSDNASAIVAALLAANGKSTAHTYTAYDDVERSASRAEEKLTALVGKTQAPGAKWSDRSGDALPNAYKYSRQTTYLTLERRSSAWWLIGVASVQAYKDAAKDSLTLTQAQRDFAVARFCSQFHVAAPETINA